MNDSGPGAPLGYAGVGRNCPSLISYQVSVTAPACEAATSRISQVLLPDRSTRFEFMRSPNGRSRKPDIFHSATPLLALPVGRNINRLDGPLSCSPTMTALVPSASVIGSSRPQKNPQLMNSPVGIPTSFQRVV